MAENDNLIQLTADIVSSMVGSNSVATADVPGLIKSVHSALSGLGTPVPEPEAEKPKGAVSPRASIKPDGLISMIDGKKYQTLRRHITRHGYTPESYREAFGLPRDYPLTSANYSELRRGMAKLIGLGRKAAETVVDTITPGSDDETPAEPAKRGRKPRAAKALEAETPTTETTAAATIEPVAETDSAPDTPADTAPKAKRGRPRKIVADATPDITPDAEPDAAPEQAEETPAPKKRRAKKSA